MGILFEDARRSAGRGELLDRAPGVAAGRPLDAGDPETGVLGDQALEDFQATLGILRSLLSDRLGKLVDAGILRREPYKDEIRTRERYRLTEKGLDLYPVLMALREWGDRYMAEEGPPVKVRHRDCGGEPRIQLRCDRCGEEVGARDAEPKAGPGLRAA